ncbi:hypothetical protein Cgig2_004688 [Carnegiea gigantea]|uniref:pyruvate kinase n=1 Tax=Carnegiea gigantea TaxID=171969 RepID=A0A9Q1GTW8_9CARY|nr:hypothetical protein Cgig2_004688 [Carnegiea gigantea]
MPSTNLLLEEPIRMASILEPSKPTFFAAMSKIVGTLGPSSQSVEVISGLLNAGMSVARFDFSWGDAEAHRQTLENLRAAVKATKKLCAVMLDTVGPELQVVNKNGQAISLKENEFVTLTPDLEKEASSEILPINYSGLGKEWVRLVNVPKWDRFDYNIFMSLAVKKGDTIFMGKYLFTGSETTSVWLEVRRAWLNVWAALPLF